MRTGVCPDCGLIIRKYASNFGVAEQGFWGRFGLLADEGVHWAAFWQNRLWPSYWRASWYMCCLLFVLPALVRVFEVTRDAAVVPTVVDMALWGMALAGLGLGVAVVSFYCFALLHNSRRVFLIHVLCSLGLCAVLAFLGAVLALLSAFVGYLGRVTGLRGTVNPVRAFGFAGVAFFGIVLYFAFVRLPSEKRLLEYLDGSAYSATVKDARGFAGPDFPKGSRADQYRYYRYVFVEPTRTVDSEFERVLHRLLPDFNPRSFSGQHGSDVSLLVFNAMAFRDELAADRLISPEMRLKLDQATAEWLRYREQAAARLVTALDTRAPVAPNHLRSLADTE